MFGSTVLEVAIGLTFCYASVALITRVLSAPCLSLMNFMAASDLSE